MTTPTRLSALAAAGLFVEQRISRGAASTAERAFSDAVADELTATDLSDLGEAVPTTLEATGGPVLPPREEAIARISKVNRVSDTMATEIYEALTAQPES